MLFNIVCTSGNNCIGRHAFFVVCKRFFVTKHQRMEQLVRVLAMIKVKSMASIQKWFATNRCDWNFTIRFIALELIYKMSWANKRKSGSQTVYEAKNCECNDMKAIPTTSVWFKSNKAYASGHIKSEMGKHLLSIPLKSLHQNGFFLKT